MTEIDFIGKRPGDLSVSQRRFMTLLESGGDLSFCDDCPSLGQADKEILQMKFSGVPLSVEDRTRVCSWWNLFDRFEAITNANFLRAKHRHPYLIPKDEGGRHRIFRYFSTMESFLNYTLNPEFGEPKDGTRIDADDWDAYCSMRGLVLQVPWRDRGALDFESLTPKQGWEWGWAPLAHLDVNFNPTDGHIYIYELSRHKFGWKWGLSMPLYPDISKTESLYGLPNDFPPEPPMKMLFPETYKLYNKITEKFARMVGVKPSDKYRLEKEFYKFTLRRVLGFYKLMFGKEPEKLFMVRPTQILSFRGENRLAEQVDLSPQEATLLEVLRDSGNNYEFEKRTGVEPEWLLVDNPKIT